MLLMLTDRFQKKKKYFLLFLFLTSCIRLLSLLFEIVENHGKSQSCYELASSWQLLQRLCDTISDPNPLCDQMIM
jgi:hypothetical protein